jgi:hypothetical protein
VAEDRGLLLDPAADPATRERYEKYYATTRLRRLAERRRGTPHVDLYRGLRLVMEKLGSDAGCPELALPALGGFLWSRAAAAEVAGNDLANADLLDAIRALATTIDGRTRRAVDYKNLGSEELGSIYESLLELHPDLNTDAGSFELKTEAGHERKTTGSYYTPASLVSCLLDSALDPVLDQAARRPDSEAAILKLKVCDPASGSGHFLIAAAHRIAKRLAAVRTGDEEPAPEALRKALRDVIGHCVYGVDINPMAVELCKVSLWMEALEPGKPLSFLDHHIQCGNSLLGTTPALLRRGIPEEAFEPIEGDDRGVCREYRARNRDEQRGQGTLFDQFEAPPWKRLGRIADAVNRLDVMPDNTIEGIHAKEERYAELVRSSGYEYGRLLADAWCAAFVWKKHRTDVPESFLEPITEKTFRTIEENPHKVPAPIRNEIRRLADRYHFFHWHLSFPDVFQPQDQIDEDEILGWTSGFDVVLGNPPWETFELKEQEWFAEFRPDIAKAANAAARRAAILRLLKEDPALHASFVDGRRRSEGESRLIRQTGRFPLTAFGKINSYAVFAELDRQIIGPNGRVGCIIPSGIASDDTTKVFFQDLIQSKSLVSLHSFENEEFLFSGVHHSTKFCLITLTGPDRPHPSTDFAFFCRRSEHLEESDRHFSLTAEEIRLMNPNTGTCPIFRSQRDAEINRAIYRRVPVLIEEGPPERNPWGVSFRQGLFNMASDSGLFRTREQLEANGWILEGNLFRRGDQTYLPLYEAKMVHHFDHRFGTYEGQTDAQANQGKLPELDEAQHADPHRISLPWYWVPAEEVEKRLEGRWHRQWLLGWRDICRNTDTRTVIASLVPRIGMGHTFPLALFDVAGISVVACLYANLTTFVLDYLARQKIGGTHVTYGLLKQFPVIPPDAYEHPAEWSMNETRASWLLPRVLELTFTAWDLAPFARDCGYAGPPFRWDDARRFLLRCELDAAFFHLYGINRDDAAYILDTFPVVRKKDEARHGEYRTQRVILDIYDRMAEAIRTGVPYQTLLDPPPADPRVPHPPKQ